MVTPLDELELDILAATGDIETAETAALMALQLTDDLIEMGCYMLGLPAAVERRIRRELV